MNGQRDAALKSLSAAQEASNRERSWFAIMEFLQGSASFALLTRDVTLALQLTQAAQRVASEKERAVPHAGLFDALRIHRSLHIDGPDTARALARQCLAKYQGRHPQYFADIAACNGLLDTVLLGGYSDETKADLSIFHERGFVGLRAMLTAQGFLAYDGEGRHQILERGQSKGPIYR